MTLDSTVHLLLIEDDEVDVEFMVRGFAAAGSHFSLTVTQDGIEALRLLRSQARQRPAQLCIILLDLNLPLVSGIEFLRQLRQDPALKRHIVFVLTTSNLEEDKLAAYDQQIAGYLLKSDLEKTFPTFLRLLESYRNIVEFPLVSAEPSVFA